MALRFVAHGLLAGLMVMAVATTAHAADKTKPGRTFKDCANCPQMVVVPAGTFEMGSAKLNEMRGGEARPEGPVRQVTIAKPFAVGKFEITYAEFAAFVEATGYRSSTTCSVGMNTSNVAAITCRGPLFGRTPAPNDPVTCVSWTDAVAYTAWLSGKTGKPYRLLTEAEWEYAARAGTKTKWPWGEDDLAACTYENVFDLDSQAALPPGSKLNWEPLACHDGHGMLAPVGSYPANPFGLHDMLGNAWEWVEDCSLELYPAAPVDGSAVEVAGACEKRGVRGGSWYARIERHRASFRGRDTEPTSTHQFGFRIARAL